MATWKVLSCKELKKLELTNMSTVYSLIQGLEVNRRAFYKWVKQIKELEYERGYAKGHKQGFSSGYSAGKDSIRDNY
jgi:flagellar biosynthesis/type III secretory pathway protein FliH